LPRFLLKLSGEALGGAAGFGIDPNVLAAICSEIAQVREKQVQVAVVLGGGNIFRGALLAQAGMDRVTGDRMGMLATVMNGLALAGFLTARNVPCSLYSAQAIAGTVAGYDRDEALAALDANRVVIVAGGTGNPYFTTDTAACLRAVELGADAVLKATTVDGVYNADPKIDAAATKYDTVTYDEVLARELGVMDLTAIVLCKEHDMPLVVFDFAKKGALVDIANGATVGTRVVSA
jgi:uridylate kinase